MQSQRICSFAGSIAAVSWRLSCPETPDITAEVEVVAAPIEEGGRLVANVTVRLRAGKGWGRGHVSLDGRHLSSFKVSPSQTGLHDSFGHLFRDAVVLPLEVVDGRRHVIAVVFDELEGGAADTQPARRVFGTIERRAAVTHETAFYARRVSMSASARFRVSAA
jgi:hypothetical protein